VNSDLPGGPAPGEYSPEELGTGEPGLEQLLRTLTSPGTPGELAGEQAALTMFRAHVHAPAPAPAPAPASRPDLAAANGTAVAADALAAAGALTGSDRGRDAVQPVSGRTRPMRQLPGRRTDRPRAGRWPGGRGVPRLRLASIGAAALLAGFASAAYAAALPAPVQHAAYVAFHWAGVPDTHHTRPTSSSGGSSSVTTPTAGHSSRPGAHSTPPGSTSGSHPGGGKKSGKPAGSPTPSASPGSTSPATGPVALAISVLGGATQVPAGTSVTFDGQLTAGTKPDANVFVRLMERPAGHLVWVRVDRAETNNLGDVVLTSPDLTRNARFRLAYATGTRSQVVVITVVPGLTTSLRLGPKGIKDYLTVSTTYAQKGDVVLLQVFKSGSWVTLQQHSLNAKGATVFTFSATKRQNEQVQAVLEATNLHAGATSASVTVPPPA
jgi:hypothetical protein